VTTAHSAVATTAKSSVAQRRGYSTNRRRHACLYRSLWLTQPEFTPGSIQTMIVFMTFDRITFDPDIMGGSACIRGMRIPVSVIVGQLAHGATTEEVLADYPDLEKADVQQALEYAAWLAQEEIVRA
jgi:uncharacterized protein (DUF433 family)